MRPCLHPTAIERPSGPSRAPPGHPARVVPAPWPTRPPRAPITRSTCSHDGRRGLRPPAGRPAARRPRLGRAAAAGGAADLCAAVREMVTAARALTDRDIAESDLEAYTAFLRQALALQLLPKRGQGGATTHPPHLPQQGGGCCRAVLNALPGEPASAACCLANLCMAAAAASAVMTCLDHASARAATFPGPSQRRRAGRGGVQTLSPAEAVAACSWATALMSEAARLLLLTVLAAGQAPGMWNPAGVVLPVLSCCCETADKLRHHMQSAAGLPHMVQLQNGPARPGLHAPGSTPALHTQPCRRH